MIKTIKQLEAHYGEVSRNALIKELDHLSPEYAAFVEQSPFCVLATVGPEGLDVSPRGDPVGQFARIEDSRTLLLPDRRGNNRIDSLRNIVRDDRVSLIFLIPGAGETLRIIGHAAILVDPTLLASFAIDGKTPRSVLRVRVASVYFQCQKAMRRAGLWDAEAIAAAANAPTAGRMLKAALRDENFDVDAFDRTYSDRVAKTIY